MALICHRLAVAGADNGAVSSGRAPLDAPSGDSLAAAAVAAAVDNSCVAWAAAPLLRCYLVVAVAVAVWATAMLLLLLPLLLRVYVAVALSVADVLWQLFAADATALLALLRFAGLPLSTLL